MANQITQDDVSTAKDVIARITIALAKSGGGIEATLSRWQRVVAWIRNLVK